MKLLSTNFLLYTIAGLWRPLHWFSKRSKFLYSVRTCFTMYLVIYLLLNHLADFILVINNTEDRAEDFAMASFIFFSMIMLFFKATVTVRYRDSIINVMKILQEKPCAACNEDESGIQEKFDRFIRSCTVRYLILAMFSVMSITVGEINKGLEGQLPFRAWVPWDCTSFFLFWFTFLQETVAMIIGAVISVAAETTIFGFCLQICAQFEILKSRLRRKHRETEETSKHLYNVAPICRNSNLSEHIAHHICIIRLAEAINKIFSQVIFTQFFVSIIVLCLSIYYMSLHATITDIATWMVFIICMFVQIFVYCWAGNQITLQSTEMSDAVYHMDWTLMRVSERKALLMIMKRSTRPIKFTSSFMVTLSLESYANLLKTSYSAFNILQQS